MTGVSISLPHPDPDNHRLLPGADRLWRLLAAECERVGIRRPLVVTDPGVRAAGVLQQALDALPGLPVAVFDQTPSNPTEAAVRAAVAVYRARAATA
jgi:alcohol dehydrogenase class IV